MVHWLLVRVKTASDERRKATERSGSGDRHARHEPAPPREKLLAAVIGYVAAHGFSDLSLREVAAAIGTSHRMLIYHFGSREGLLVAVVQAVEAGSRGLLAELAADPSRPLAD